MPASAERQVVEWVNDAFAILSRSAPAFGAPELNLRRGLEAIVRHLASAAPPVFDGLSARGTRVAELSLHELHLVRQALDASLVLFARYERDLNTAQRRIQILVRACRRNADDAVQAQPGSAPRVLNGVGP